MQHTRPHQREDFARRTARPSTDGFVRRGETGSYQRRSSGMIPGNDEEYMISLGAQASRRASTPLPKQSVTEKIVSALDTVRRRIARQKQTLNQASLAIVGIVVLVGLVGLQLSGQHDPVTANDDDRQLSQNNGDTPHGRAPHNQGAYAAASDMPERLVINKLGIDTRVTRLGVRENSEPKYPQNIYDAGWYENSAKPGDKGAALLIGHIQGAEKQGVFHDLANLVPGDEFQVETGDGTIRNYYIVKMEVYDRGQVNYDEVLRTGLDGKPGLNLLTAVGAFAANSDVTQQLGVFAIEKSSFLDENE
ncbi:MAG: class F sortase [Candidatus Saccharibacteria bacterium]|nr:class F sortase [Candidatus Saccharibacteria bacterium]